MKAFYTRKGIAAHLGHTAKQLKIRMHLVDTITVYDCKGNGRKAYVASKDILRLLLGEPLFPVRAIK